MRQGFCLGIALSSLMWAHPAWAATKYHYCISSAQHQGNVVVTSGPGPVDLGKEWYRTRAAQDFCQFYNQSACSASDFSQAICGGLPEEEIQYKSINDKQFKAIFSGNPITAAQSIAEIAIGLPVAVISEAPKVAKKVCRWVAKHC